MIKEKHLTNYDNPTNGAIVKKFESQQYWEQNNPICTIISEEYSMLEFHIFTKKLGKNIYWNIQDHTFDKHGTGNLFYMWWIPSKFELTVYSFD